MRLKLCANEAGDVHVVLHTYPCAADTLCGKHKWLANRFWANRRLDAESIACAECRAAAIQDLGKAAPP